MRLNSEQLIVNVRNMDEKKVWKSGVNLLLVVHSLPSETAFAEETKLKAMLWVAMFCRKAVVT